MNTVTSLLPFLTVFAFSVLGITAVVTISDINKKRKIEKEQELKKNRDAQLKFDFKEESQQRKRVKEHA